MARKLRPVDRTPICDPVYVRRIDPLWMPGRVPKYFWEDRAHRRDYLLWVADKLGFCTMQNFYRLELFPSIWRKYRGAGLNGYWHGSPLAAVRDGFPWHEGQVILAWVKANRFLPAGHDCRCHVICGKGYFKPCARSSFARLEPPGKPRWPFLSAVSMVDHLSPGDCGIGLLFALGHRAFARK